MSRIISSLLARFRSKRQALDLKTEQEPRPRPRVEINFGVDFGTSFTKVCYRDAGREISGLVDFGVHTQDDWKQALIPSSIKLAPDGRLLAGMPTPPALLEMTRDWDVVDQIKMRLASLDLGNELGRFFEPHDAANTPEQIEILSATCIANILHHSKKWISAANPGLFADRDVVWTANIGVPVQIYDSPAVDRFERVLSAAWRMIGIQPEPITTLEQARDLYQRSVALDTVTDCHAIPELIGSIHSLVQSPSAPRGIYVYFDIGGGTLDGVSFKVDIDDGVPTASAYYALITPLGIEALAAAHHDHELTTVLFRPERPTHSLTEVLSEEVERIRRQTGKILGETKKKDAHYFMDWLVSQSHYQRSKAGPIRNTSDMLPIVMGGGGKNSGFYRNAIESTWSALQLGNMGIPPFRLIDAPPPDDVEFGAVPKDQFYRFSVAYGLSIPHGENLKINLPRDLPDNPMKYRGPDIAGHYED